MRFKSFRSPKEDIRVESDSGHMGYITKEFAPLPEVLWGAAYTFGAISEDVVVSDLDSFVIAKKKEQDAVEAVEYQSIKESLKVIFINPIGYLDKSNNLILRKVIAFIGRPVKRDLVDSIWEEVVSELGG